MLVILQSINSFLDLKLVQWALVFYMLIITIAFGVYGFRYNALRLEHAFLQTELAKTASALQVQNKAILEASEATKKIQENYDRKVSEASKLALQSQKNLSGILDYGFEGECPDIVKSSLKIVKGGKVDK